MQISEHLPQFIDRKSLFIVTGLHEADFYVVADGEINKVDNFTVEKTNPDITTGFVIAESGGDKDLKRIRQTDFLKEFKDHLPMLLSNQGIKMVYLFAPPAVIKELEALLPEALKNSIHLYEGNFHKEHPFKLLEKTVMLK